MRWIKPNNLKLDPDLSGIWPIDDTTLQAITESMRERGYDQAEPLVIWSGQDVIVDGHTRFEAAKRSAVATVYVDERTFEDKRAAVEYAVARQRDRRNLSKEALRAGQVRSIEVLDRVKTAGRPEKLASVDANSGKKSAAETAEKVGVSQAQVERVRAVLASPDEPTKQALRNGTTTVRAAVKAIKEAEAIRQDSVEPALSIAAAHELKAMYSAAEWQELSMQEKDAAIEFSPLTPEGQRAAFNAVNEMIDWAKWSWNPVTGCLHNCEYCYARDIANHRFAQKFVPTFIPGRLHAPSNARPPVKDGIGWRNVFVCSMADLFGKWVPQEWIDAVFEQVRLNHQWNFLFLTKFPQRLAEIEWPHNAWCGTSVDRQYRVEIAERSFRDVQAGVKWLSCEPMMERLTFSSLEMFDWVVIGAASKSTQTPEFQPPWEWVEHLMTQARAAGCKVYIKPNLKSRPQEYPGEFPGEPPSAQLAGVR